MQIKLVHVIYSIRNGVDTYISIPAVVTDALVLELFFWIQGDDDQTGANVTFLSKTNFVDFTYNTVSDQLTVTITGSSTTAVGTYTGDLLDGNPHSISMAVDALAN